MKNYVLTVLLSAMSMAASADRVQFSPDSVPPGMPTTIDVGKVKYMSLAQMSPGVKEASAADLENIARGYGIMDDPVAERHENYKPWLRQQADIEPLIKVKLADIAATDLGGYVYEGLIPDGPSLPGPWTSVIRVFDRPDGVKMFLQERDYVADGGAIFIIKELMNAKVKKTPAHLMLKKAANGAEMTELSWATDKKYFFLTVWDDATKTDGTTKYGRKWLLDLAGKLD